jgi:phosphomannomutase
MNVPDDHDIPFLESKLQQAGEAGELSAPALENLQAWLAGPQYAAYREELVEHIESQQWQLLDDLFWTVIPFGTGGRRGRMYPIGCNAINDRTIGESAAGLAAYVSQQAQQGSSLSCAIGYDTRHRSRHFAELCAGVMVAQGFTVYFLDDYRSTPELSFLVRDRNCDCGIMVTASHNPPSDNAVKVYWSSGGQVLPPHDQGIIDCVGAVGQIEQADFSSAVEAGEVVICTAETDKAYLEALSHLSLPAGGDLKILYSPLHGVGSSVVLPLLAQQGFDQVQLYPGHAQPDGDFPNVPDHVANPENAAVFDEPIEYARQQGLEIVLATDPDCDRMGCAAPLTLDTSGPWQVFNGNQLSALLADFVLDQHRQSGNLSADHYVVTTLVTTGMVRRIAESYGVQTRDQLLVGFKWICGAIDQYGPENFLYGTEESHGFLTGTHVRDKDGPNACLVIAQLAAAARAAGQSLVEKLDSLYWQHGFHDERLWTIRMEGSGGMTRMQALMDRVRNDPPAELGGIEVVALRDYFQQSRRQTGGENEPLEGPRGNLLVLELAGPIKEVAMRPSGTEPKIKFYGFGYMPPEQLADLELTRQQVSGQMDGVETAMRSIAEA